MRRAVKIDAILAVALAEDLEEKLLGRDSAYLVAVVMVMEDAE